MSVPSRAATANLRRRWAVAIVAGLLAIVSIWQLEGERAGLTLTRLDIGTTPATLYRTGSEPAPLVVVAHGFAGSRQLMEGFSLTLARAGYAVLAFDFEGHGRNPVPMSGDVTRIEGTTRLLVDETLRVLAAGLALPGMDGRAALLGHSMASDIVVRAAARAPEVKTVVAVSMFSEAVTADFPTRLLTITGEWEAFLRRAALEALRQVDPEGREGMTVRSGATERRAAVAPMTEHVSVLFSATALAEARDWLDTGFGRTSDGAVARTGPWLAALLASLVALAWPLAGMLPRLPAPSVAIGAGPFALISLMPALIAPVLATRIHASLLPVLVADYLVVHLALQGMLQLGLLAWNGVLPRRPRALPCLAFLAWGIGVFGLSLDRYGASFWPIPERVWIIAALALGAVPYMLADATATLGTGAGTLRRLALRGAGLVSLGLAVALDFERLFFLAIILPVIVLFFLVFGLMGRWVGLRSGSGTAGLALGLILAWSLGVSFPLFAPGP